MVNVKRKVTNFEILFFYSNFGIQNLKMTYIKELKFSNWDFITNFGTLFVSLLFFLIIGKFVLLLISLFSPFIFLSLLGIYVFGFLQTQHLLYCIRKSAVPALSLVLHKDVYKRQVWISLSRQTVLSGVYNTSSAKIRLSTKAQEGSLRRK